MALRPIALLLCTAIGLAAANYPLRYVKSDGTLAQIPSAPNCIYGPQDVEFRTNVTGSVYRLCDIPDGLTCSPTHQAILVERFGGCSYETIGRRAKDIGCRVVIAQTEYLTTGGSITAPLQFDGSDVSDLANVILVSVSQEDWDPVVPAMTEVDLLVNRAIIEANAWWILWNSPGFFIFVHIFLPLFQFVVLVDVARRLAIFIRAAKINGSRGSNFVVPRVVISLEVGGGIVRLVYLCVDPLWSTNVLPRAPAQILLTITVPILIINSAILAQLWRSSIATKSSTIFATRRSIIGFTLFALLAFGGDLFGSLTRAFYRVTFYSLVVTAFLYIGCLAVLGVFFFFFASRVYFKLRARLTSLVDGNALESMTKRQIRALMKMTRAMAQFGLTTGMLAILFSGAAWRGVETPYGAVILIGGTQVVLVLDSWLRASMLQPPVSVRSRSGIELFRPITERVRAMSSSGSDSNGSFFGGKGAFSFSRKKGSKSTASASMDGPASDQSADRDPEQSTSGSVTAV